MVQCGECMKENSNYKCPLCLNPFCCLICWKQHQNNCKKNQNTSPCKDNDITINDNNNIIKHNSDAESGEITDSDDGESLIQTGQWINNNKPQMEDIYGIYTLNEDHLNLLKYSNPLKNELKDPEVRKILTSIYHSKTPIADIGSKMKQPYFRQLANKILSTLHLYDSENDVLF